MVDFKAPDATDSWLGDSIPERVSKRAIRALTAIGWLVHGIESRYYGEEGGFSAEDMLQTLATIRKELVRGLPHPLNAQYQRQGVKLRKDVAPKGETSRFLAGLDSIDDEEDLGPLKPEEIPF